MGAVHIGIGHDDDPVVAAFAHVEVVIHSAADGGDQRLDLLVFEHFVPAGLFNVQKFASNRQDRLEGAVASLLGGTACRVSLDDVEFTDVGILAGAVRQLAGEGEALQRSFALDQFACLAGRFAGVGGHNRLHHDVLRHLRILLHEGPETLVDHRIDNSLHFIVAEFRFGLSFELRIGNLHADDGGEAFAGVLAGHSLVALQKVCAFRVAVDRAGERRLEAGKMRAAFKRVDVVRIRIDRGREGVVVLHGHFDVQTVLGLVHVDDRMQNPVCFHSDA